jgi:pterin-4a-carbinolamine dehydratase
MKPKISHLLNEYFEPDKVYKPELNVGFSCPVTPRSFDWEIHKDPERFSKRFKFDSRQRMISFLNEVLYYEDETGHHGEIRIDHTEVDISVYTHDVNRITELDKEYVRSVDYIHRDVLDFEYR